MNKAKINMRKKIKEQENCYYSQDFIFLDKEPFYFTPQTHHNKNKVRFIINNNNNNFTLYFISLFCCMKVQEVNNG